MAEHWGRFTAGGGAQVEAEITKQVERLAQALKAAVRPEEAVALLLVGDYGRGEGRVCADPLGTQRPADPLELLLLTAPLPLSERNGLARRLARLIHAQTEESLCQFTIQVVPLPEMRHSQATLWWHNARFGHKLLFGDSSVLMAQERFRLECVSAADIRATLVRSAVPIMVEGLLRERGRTSPRHSELLGRNLDAAVIGFGDALLLARGHYHWSGMERQCRMAEQDDVPETFRSLYDDAWQRTFVPSVETGSADLCSALPSDIAAFIAPVHLATERILQRAPQLEWTDFPDAAVIRTSRSILAPGGWGQALANMARAIPHGGTLSLGARFAWLTLGPLNALAMVAPVPLYDLRDVRYRRLAAAALDAESDSLRDLRSAFVSAWSVFGLPSDGACDGAGSSGAMVLEPAA